MLVEEVVVVDSETGWANESVMAVLVLERCLLVAVVVQLWRSATPE